MSQDVVRILEEDPDLGAGLPEAHVAEAGKHLLATRVAVEGPTWTPPRTAEPGHLGLLVLDGLLVRQVDVHGSSAWEPLGPGDVLQPWQDDTALGILDVDSSWTVLAPAGMAVLDARFAGALARWPVLIGAYGTRLTRRSRCLVDLWAIEHHRRAAARVHLLLWFFADRWGRVTPEGLVVPFPFTHEWIARFVGVRRPTVTQALTELGDAGLVSRHLRTKGWIVHEARAHCAALVSRAAARMSRPAILPVPSTRRTPARTAIRTP